jgi:hypothetical protein
MTRPIQDTVDLLLLRTRQTAGISVTNDEAVYILTICQQIANVALREVTTTTSFATTADIQLYETRTDLAADAVDIVDVSRSTRGELDNLTNLEDLSAYDIDWFSATDASEFLAWSAIGRDYFIIYPAKGGASSVDITYVDATPIEDTYADDGNMTLSDESVELALKLAEAVILIKSRNTEVLGIAIETLKDLLGAIINADD